MESIGFTCKKKNIANFHVLGLFMPKKPVKIGRLSNLNFQISAIIFLLGEKIE
jgi:hypothetical protein